MMIEEASMSEMNSAMSKDRFAGDQAIPREFYMHPKKKVPYLRIFVSKDHIVDRAPTEMDKQRFIEDWRRFELNQERVIDGTPLAEWDEVEESMIRELNHRNIYSIEHLASLPDVQLDFMGANGLKQKAMAWVEENAGQSAKLDAAMQMIEDLQKRLNEVEAAPDVKGSPDVQADVQAEKIKPKRRGRPPKKEAGAEE